MSNTGFSFFTILEDPTTGPKVAPGSVGSPRDGKEMLRERWILNAAIFLVYCQKYASPLLFGNAGQCGLA